MQEQLYIKAAFLIINGVITMKRLTQADVESLYSSLRSKKNEKDVENAWRAIFKSYFIDKSENKDATEISSPCNVDGLIVEHRIVFALRILMEFKDGTDLQKAYDRARVTIQCIYYMHYFIDNGIELPNVIVGADENQAFVLYAPNFYKYLEREGVDWTIPSSEAYKDPSNRDFMEDLINDRNLSVFVYDLNSGRNNIKSRTATIQNLFDEINSIATWDPNTGDTFKVNVTESNLAVLFDDFVRITFGSLKKSDKLSPVDLVNIFQQLILNRNPDVYYQLPSNINKLHLPGDHLVSINGSDLQAFLKHFNRNLSPEEQDTLISISDRLIEDITRRRKGDYWTPTIWANQAVKLLDETLNGKWKTKHGLIQDWKKDCIVWDCAAGTKNLTRDYYFNHLYSSTIHQAELDLSKEYNSYPTTNKAFQYDFLNDDVTSLSMLDNIDVRGWNKEQREEWGKTLKIPQELFDDLVEDKPLVIYINPPFGTANTRSFSSKDKSKKRNMAATNIRDLMRSDSMGKATQQLYTQFFYRIIKIINEFKLSNVILASFSPYQFRTGGDYFGTFYKYFLETLHPVTGFLFSAAEFSNVNKDWGVSFSLYSNEDAFEKSEDLNVVQFKNGSIQHLFNKTIKTVDKNDSISEWIKDGQSPKTLGDPLEKGSYTEVTSALNPVPSSKSGTYYKNSIGYMYFIGNDVEHSDTAVSIFSTYFKSGHGVNITPSNLMKAVIGFSLRRSARFDWYNGKDAFCIDDIHKKSLLEDDEFGIDCLLFSLTQYRSSYQSSLGPNSLDDDQPEVVNQWFFLPVDIMKQLYGNTVGNDSTQALFSREYARLRVSQNTPIVEKLQNAGAEFSLSPSISDSPKVQVKFADVNSFSNEAKKMLITLVDLFNSTWIWRQLAISSNPELSAERFDAGFNQLYRISKDLANDTNWAKEYANAYEDLRGSIHIYGLNEGIIPQDA